MNLIRAEGKHSKYHVAIIGGGFSGTTLAAQLVRRGGRSVSVTVLERRSDRGRGVAYGTRHDVHLLNVAAENMSAFSDEPAHFLNWAKTHVDPLIDSRSYLPRRRYGNYIEFILKETQKVWPDGITWLQADAVSVAVENDAVVVLTADGGHINADALVLAQGNFPCGDPSMPGRSENSARYVSHAWTPEATEGLSPDDSVLLIGAGLTSVDLAVSLRAREHRGPIHLLSRRGLLPQTDQACSAWEWSTAPGDFPRSARGVLAALREEVRLAEAGGVNWRSVISALRPYTQRLWSALPLPEKRRFLRHLRPYWEVHRHRVAPEIGNMLQHQLTTGKITVHAGRITRFQEDENGVTLTYADRSAGRTQEIRVQRVINCTGPETDCRKLKDPLVADLLSTKQARPDPLFIGFDVSSEGALINTEGMPSSVLFAVGPARKGRLWETTAVPEIREQVAQLAGHLIKMASRDPALTSVPEVLRTT